MKKLFSFLATLLCFTAPLLAEKVQVSTTLPSAGQPEHLYTMVNGNGLYANMNTAPTQTAENYGLFAFYAADDKDGAYYIYSYSAQKWLSYEKKSGYSNGTGFVQLTAEKTAGAYFDLNNYADDFYQIAPYNSTDVAAKYLNWFQGVGSNPLDGTVTLGLYSTGGAGDAGSRWTFSEVNLKTYHYTINAPDGVSVKIGNQTYTNGQTVDSEGAIDRNQITVVTGEGQFAVISIDDVNETITIHTATLPTQPATVAYENAVVYPQQQTAVGAAVLTEQDGVYTLSNNVLAASFMRVGNALYFGGSKAMNLEAGTEPFTVAFGAGDNVPASAMTLVEVKTENLTGNAEAVGGAEHFDGKALVARYTYTYQEQGIEIVWKAVLRDGSHYLRTEMELKGVGNVDMFNVIPMIYNVDAKAAGSTPVVVGNTRGAVLMSNKIFAGLENPVGYNTVGGATGEEDKWNEAGTLEKQSLTATSWVEVPEADVPARVTEATGAGYPDVLYYKIENIVLQKDQKVEATVTYKSGSHRLNLGGADLLDTNGGVAASDYHAGYTGTAKENNTFSIVAPNDGTYTLRFFIQKKSESVDATSEITGTIYTPKEGVVVNTEIVGIQGRWSRNTTLAAGETWKISSVVGLIAQDGSQANEDIHATQKRRSFVAYSERERAVPWRAFPAYISWYELNINRNNAADPTQNMSADQVLDVENHWKSDFYNRYGIGPKAFVIDDGWDNYGTWTFHSNFPNQMKDMAALAEQMGAGVGAWLGPVGGYGTSGNYRRAYWQDKGGMVLSNPAYYQVFKDAAYNLTQNQGDFRFFKFDGISAQFSSTGPDAGDTGNENAEGIIRLERYVREELRRDIFFNTTVGTWASPFWYHFTDATWRQENDYGESSNSNSIDRERWITYRDALVYKNYVTNSPICPINTLMTHGFILSRFGNVSKDMSYESCLRELRAAFLCGSGMVELYNDYALMNSINKGQLWADLAECIAWQKRNADVLPDAHWVGGNPWNGATAQIYGWAAWNGTKSSLALRNGSNDAKDYTFTLRQALNIPQNVNGSIILRRAFNVQDALAGLTEGTAIDIDTQLTVTLPGSSIFGFEGIDATAAQQQVTGITLSSENTENQVFLGETLVVKAEVAPANATYTNVTYTTSDPEVATVVNGLVVGLKEGTAVITVTAADGSGVQATLTVNVVTKPREPYATNFDKTTSPSRTDRFIKTISVTAGDGTAQVIDVNQALPYIDKSADEASLITCKKGDMLQVVIDKYGTWMNGYVYIDLDGDQQFSFNPDQTDQTGTEVMSFSFYNGTADNEDLAGVNSAGEQISGNGRNTMTTPAFQVNAPAGDYRIRFKMDWNSVDPGGRIAADGTCTGTNGILNNGGSIVDATLRVTEDIDTGISQVESTSTRKAMYDLSGRRLTQEPAKGVYILNSKKVIK